MTNVEALQALYAALGGDPADVADCVTIVEVLNAIAAKYEGEDDATINPEAIANIAAVAENIGGGGDNNAKFAAEPATFSANTNLTSVEIPNGVTSIGSSAFGGFRNLAKVTIPDSVTTITGNAFASTALTEITIPSSVYGIDQYVFSSCTSLSKIIVNKAEGSISGAPWGAPNATVEWTG